MLRRETIMRGRSQMETGHLRGRKRACASSVRDEATEGNGAKACMTLKATVRIYCFLQGY